VGKKATSSASWFAPRGTTLRIGCVKYLNARPLIWGWRGPVDFDHPAALCRKLARGDLDVALVSSLEYLRSPIYRIVDGVSIAARGQVYSVVMAHRASLREIRSIELDPASETSVTLLQLLLKEKKLEAQIGAVETACPNELQAKLLIGDQALRFRAEHGSKFMYWDLAEAWREMTSLPFVFALWLIRPEVDGAKEIATELRKLRCQNLSKIDELVASQAELSADFCRTYYRQHLCFDLGEGEKAGLVEFHRRCVANAIDVAPQLKFDFV
jgi:chorismate dehydratase